MNSIEMRHRQKTISRTSAAVIGVALPVALAGVVVPLDLHVAEWLHRGDGRWLLTDTVLSTLVHELGQWPALLFGVTSLAALASQTLSPTARSFKNEALFIFVVYALGPGLLVNAILKVHVDRPRPRDVVEFGGERAYAPPWVDGQHDGGKSFPSGHAATSFALATVGALATRRRWLVVMTIGGFAYGGVVGFVRMADGSHFFTDVLWSAILVGMLMMSCARFLPEKSDARDGPPLHGLS